LSDFNSLWRHIVERSQGFPTVQEYSELQHVFNLMKGCSSYLEIGTAEGNSLYVLAQALNRNATIACVDLCEKHTEKPRNEVVTELRGMGYMVCVCAGDSTNPATLHPTLKTEYDCVLIDGGHDYATVISDAYMYGKYATKYLFFHDVTMPEVNRAFEEYCESMERKGYKMINSTSFGYGIIKI